MVLEVIAEKCKEGDAKLQANAVLGEAVHRLGAGENKDIQRAVLVFWNDLFRSGQIGWGAHISRRTRLTVTYPTGAGRRFGISAATLPTPTDTGNT